VTRIIRYAGVQLADNTVRLEDGIAGLTECADGSLGTAGVRFDDPTGADTYTLLQRFEIDETDCVLPRMFTGYSYNVRNNRGPFRIDAGRTHDLDIGDLNFLLHLQPARGSTAKRPLESGDARMAWLLASVCLDGIVYDSGLVGSNPNMFDEADYTGAFADEIMPDLCVSSSDDIGRIFFVYWDENTQRPSLFIDLPTANVRVSDLRISNELSDVDNDITFAPYISPEVSGDGTEIYCSVFFKYKTGTIYVHNQTTHDAFFASAGFHRQAVYETSRVGSLSTAQRHADQFLAAHSGQRDVITCTVKLPPSKVNLIGQGMLVSCKFEHLPTYETFTDLRVAQRTVLMTQTTSEYYDVQLTLNRYGITPAGGGPGTGDFPQPPPAAGIEQFVSGVVDGTGHLVLPSAPTVGNTLVTFITGRLPPCQLATAVPWTEHPAGLLGNTGFFNDSGRMAYRPVDGGDTAAVQVAVSDTTQAVLWEVSGLVTPSTTAVAEVSTLVQPAAANAGTITTAAGDLVLAGIVIQCSGWGGNGDTTLSDDAEYTTVASHEILNPGDPTEPFSSDTAHPALWFGTLIGATAGTHTPSVSITGAGFNFGGWGGLQMAFAGSAAANPPSPGQDLGWHVPTAVPDGEDFTWDLGFPFSDGSLEVRLDGQDQTGAVTSYDGACGEFTVSFEVLPGELLEARGIGR
jgi:hypothetical protein